MSTKELIFEKALNLFSQKGYAATSIRNICSEVGIKESSFYNHYVSKEQLLEAVISGCRQALMQNTLTEEKLEELTSQFSLREMMMRSLEQYVSIWNNPTASQMWFVVSMEQYRNPVAGQLVIDEGIRRIEQSERSFAMFQSKGKMKPGNPRALANLYVFSIRSLHLDYGLRKLYNQQAEAAYLAMQEVCDLFCSQWEA